MVHHIGEVFTSACLLRLGPCIRSVELFRSLPGDLCELRIPVYNRRLQEYSSSAVHPSAAAISVTILLMVSSTIARVSFA